VRESGVGVADRIQIQEDRSWNVPGGILIHPASATAGQIPGAIHDSQVGRAETGFQPVS
jgi:hypothetical protein